MMARRFWVFTGVGMAGALLGGTLLCAAGRNGAEAGQGATAALGRAPATKLGVNTTGVQFHIDRAFQNLFLGGWWAWIGPDKRLGPVPAEFVDPSSGDLRALPPGTTVQRILTPPGPNGTSVVIRCTFTGAGTVTPLGPGRFVTPLPSSRKGEIQFRWTVADGSVASIQVRDTNAADPIRNFDCREADSDPSQRFAKPFVDYLAKFKVVRFMGWQNMNDNVAVDWSNRHTLESIAVNARDGVSIEDIAAISNATGVEPWVSIPWNATDAYVRGFATMLHQRIPASRPIYVEVANEVWNGGFAVARQAANEGLAERLSQNPAEAQLKRLAEKTVQVMKIWEDVFLDRPHQLVRVVALQNAVPERANFALSYPGLLDHIDAIATAPYFGFDLMQRGETRDLATIFARLDESMDTALAQARAFRLLAQRSGKRYIAYEGGQHVVLPHDVPLLEAIERDPRMYDAYRRYLAAWKRDLGDTIALTNTSGKIGGGGAWGMVEYIGQPAEQAPKWRAVAEALQN